MAEATLADVLAARDRRAVRQREWTERYGTPLVCFTMNIAGPVKVDVWTEYAYRVGIDRLKAGLASMHYPVIAEEETSSVAGREWLAAVEAPPLALKRLCVHLEEEDELGRLFDMDVLDPDGAKLERGAERRCLVCGLPGRGCASRRAHPLQEIVDATRRRIAAHRLNARAEAIASLAVRCLLDEVDATPKPGLVDRRNNGSHRDMDIFTFHASAAALWPYFHRCFLSGAATRELPPGEAFGALRALGLEAERAMLAGTGGVNTHKGAIYTVGILCAAAGRLLPEEPGNDRPALHGWLQTCAELAGNHAREPVSGATHGEQAMLRCGVEGVRGEVAGGLPSVERVGIPALLRAEAMGFDLNDRCVYALLCLLASVRDTNMIARGGPEAAVSASKRVQALLTGAGGRMPSREALERLDGEFIRMNLSPGGCADLLAASLLAARYAGLMDRDSNKNEKTEESERC